MAGTEEDLPDDTRQAIEALRRLVLKHDAIPPDQAVEAVEALVADADVEAGAEELLNLEPEETGDAEEKESPTA